MRYKGLVHVWTKDGNWDEIEEYEQPVLRHLHWWVLEQLDKVTYKNPVGRWVSRHVDELSDKYHSRSCDGDCSFGEVRRRGQEPSMEKFCGWMPPTCRVDCYLFDLSRRGRTETRRFKEIKTRTKDEVE